MLVQVLLCFEFLVLVGFFWGEDNLMAKSISHFHINLYFYNDL